MDYSQAGIIRKQKALRSPLEKLARKLLVSIVTLCFFGFVALGIIGTAAGIGVFQGILATSPSIENIDVTPVGISTFVYDAKGNQIAKLVATNSNRIPVSMDMVPRNLANAFVAIEDERFYEHNGIDIKGIFRAGFIALQEGNLSQGASTITQQLLKNSVFVGWTSETQLESIKRKIQEQYLAIQLEEVMSKDEILLNYMNTINLGQNTLGVQAASLRYFNKSVRDLNLSECAVIASITQNPSANNPISHPEKNAKRRKSTLDKMLELGFITEQEYDTAMADDVYSRIQVVNQNTGDDTINSYFVDALTEDLLEDLVASGYTDTQAYTMLYSGGLKINATQDPDIQKICDDIFMNEENYPDGTRWRLDYALTVSDSAGELHNYSSEMFQKHFKETNSSFNMLYASQEAVDEGIAQFKADILKEGDEVVAEDISVTPQPQVSLTVMDQHTGAVVAMEGGRGEKTASRTLNRATSTYRQPGSTFKVVSTYAPALDAAGLTLATVQNDAPFSYAGGKPVANWYGKNSYRGIQSLRDGIRDSLNVVTVKTLTQITPQLGYDYLQKFGFTTLVEGETINGKYFSDIQQSLALGGITKGVYNIELNAAYASIANGGNYIKPKLYTTVEDHEGNIILDNREPDSSQVITPQTAFLLTDAMQDVVTSGTGTACNFASSIHNKIAIAGKTGTTSDYNDVWFAGYTPYYTATTWAGFDNNVKLSAKAEKNLAKTLWRKVMEEIHMDLPAAEFDMPDGIVTGTVCRRSGRKGISGLCDGYLKSEYFAEGTIPTDSCNVHYAGMICQYDGVPAAELCPFKASGVLELTSNIDAQVTGGGGTAVSAFDAEGNPIPITPSKHCHHDEAFYADPNHELVLMAEQLEMQQRAQAAMDAAQAAQAAALAAQQSLITEDMTGG